MENDCGRKEQIWRAEAGPCASCSAEGVNRKDEFKSWGFGFRLEKRIVQELPLVA